MKPFIRTLSTTYLLFISQLSLADVYTLPIQLDYGLIKKAVVSQLFKGQGDSVEVWHDKHKCSYVNLSNPRISGENGQLKLLNDVQAQLGTAIAGQCLPMAAWAGALETFQKPTISPDGKILSIPITKANAFDQNGRQLQIDKLQHLLLKAVQPKLADVKLDLQKSRADIEKTLLDIVPKEYGGEVQKSLDTLKFTRAEANDDGIKVELGFDAAAKKIVAKPEAPFSEAEQKQWQAVWKEWDGFLSRAIAQASKESKSPELKDTLTEILLDSRRAFQAGIKAQSPESGDPVRTFFLNTWDKLGPHMKTLAKELPEVHGLRYLSFIAATDVLYQLESIGAPFGLEFSSDGLRRIGRLLMAEKQAAKKG